MPKIPATNQKGSAEKQKSSLLLVLWIYVSNAFAAMFFAPLWWPLLFLERQGYMSRLDPVQWTCFPENAILFLAKFISRFLPVVCKSDVEQVELKGKQILFVSNHQLFAMDTFFLWPSIINATGIYPRGLVDRFHFYIPLWDRIILFLGGILANRALCSKAMESGLPLLVFPGGANEGFRSGGLSPYVLEWRKRKGFARIAAEHKYTIVPISSIGVDDNFYILCNLRMSWIFKLIGDPRPSNFTIPIFIWNPFALQRIYVKLGKPIAVDKYPDYGGTNVTRDESYTDEIRDRTKEEIENGFQELMRLRADDKSRFLLWRG